MEIAVLQFLHLPPSKKKETIGMLLTASICFRQAGQKDRGFTMDSPLGIRYRQTFTKEPIDAPSMKDIMARDKEINAYLYE
jgi:hypothetical protein